jgi:hypothetical protein
MPVHDDLLVCVQREWNGWRTGQVRLHDLQDIHWFQPSGAPRRLAHGYIACTNIVAGALPHDCERASAPHRLLVCILKSHTGTSLYAEIARRADEQQMLPTQARACRPMNCATRPEVRRDV